MTTKKQLPTTPRSPWVLIPMRIIAAPFVAAVHAIFLTVQLIRHVCNFIAYGGENIIYDKKLNRKSIMDVYNLVSEKHLEEK